MRKAKILKIKNQKHNFHFPLLLIGLIIIIGCGKKSPIGYNLIKDRAGDIKLATGSFDYSKPLSDTFCYMTASSYLFAGQAEDFEAKTFLRFKIDTDTIVTPESLWVIGNDSGKIYVYKIADSLNMDSITWSNAPNQSSFMLLDSANILPESTHILNIENYGADTVFYIAICGITNNMASIHSYHAGNKLYISLKGDTITKVYANKATYVDTSFFQNTSFDSFPIIQTGAYVSKCSLYLNINLTDTDTIYVDSLSDSLRTAFGFDSAIVNKATFKIWIDTAKSYEYDDKLIKATYNGITSSAYPSGDSLALSLDLIIGNWFKEGEKLSLILSGSSNEISRVVFKSHTAKLDVTYTLPPKSRKK